MLEFATDSLGPLNTLGPLFGGLVVIIWLAWRLFWKVDRRSQLELALKDKTIKELTEKLDIERTKRFEAQETAANSQARETALVTRVSDLVDLSNRLREDIASLRTDLRTLREGIQ